MSTNHDSKRSALVAWAVVSLAVAGAGVVACGGKAGDKCSSNNDCNSSLICQPVEGRNADYCCGAEGPGQTGANVADNCQPLGSGSGSGSSAGSGTGSSPPPAQDAAASD